jgi:hypothetical protein
MTALAEQTIQERAIEMGLEAYDTALPQMWVDEMRDKGHDVRGHFVWCYDIARVLGLPVAMTPEGESMIR